MINAPTSRPVEVLLTAGAHQVYDRLLRMTGRRDVPTEEGRVPRDEGAVSLEQVLWFVAAGVSVAVIATILWNSIKSEAEKPVDAPVAA